MKLEKWITNPRNRIITNGVWQFIPAQTKQASMKSRVRPRRRRSRRQTVMTVLLKTKIFIFIIILYFNRALTLIWLFLNASNKGLLCCKLYPSAGVTRVTRTLSTYAYRKLSNKLIWGSLNKNWVNKDKYIIKDWILYFIMWIKWI